MASLTILKGGAHTGKSTALYDKIAAHRDAGEHAILLVPEQATYAAEQKLCARLGGLLGVEVYSFERFSERLLSRTGHTRPSLSVEGRQMVLRRAAFRKKAELSVFSRVSQTNGFAQTMDELIGRFKQSCITPDDLERAIGGMDRETLLYRKLSDILVIYRESEAFLRERYLTAQDLLTEALAVLDEAELSDTYVYVDDLDRTREQVMRLLEGIILRAKGVTVTLRADPAPALSALFRMEEERAAALAEFCAGRGIPFLTKTFTETSGKVDPALDHLCRGLFSAAQKPFGTRTDAVRVTGYATAKLEADMTADRILELVKADPTLRYSDVAIVVSSMETYAPILRRAFRLRNIPLFFDASRPILGHAATDFVLSSVRAATNALNADDVLHVLKSGYADVALYDVEFLENYLIRYGLYGSALMQPFVVGDVPKEAERARGAIAPKLLALHDALLKETAGEKVRGVYAYLRTMQLKERLQSEADELLKSGDAQDAQTYAQMWNTLMTMFSQIDAIMGDVPMGQREFAALLEEGLSGYSIGVLPGRKDQVVLGDLVRTRLNRSRILFILGCNEGAFPPARSDDALLNDAELRRMESSGLSVWGKTELLSEADRLQLYTLLSKATDRIFFSYPCTEELFPSSILNGVRTLLSLPEPKTVMRSDAPLPASEPVGMEWMSALFETYHAEHIVPMKLPALYEYFSNAPAYADVTDALRKGRAGTAASVQLGKAVAQKLYGETPAMSASRLEQYARCPFAQYLTYGLDAQERPQSGERVDNIGTFLHDALDRFIKTAQTEGKDLRTMSNAEADEIVDRVLGPLVHTHNDGLYERSPRSRGVLPLRTRMVRNCAYSVLRQIREGGFTIAATEAGFGRDKLLDPVYLSLPDGKRIPVTGYIDRIDRSEDGTMFRIVDYKTGKKHIFDSTKFSSGEMIQLPLYLEVAKQLGGEAVGMYYMPMTAEPPPSPEVLPMNKLSGITASDEAAIRANDGHLGAESELIKDLKTGPDGYTGDLATREELEQLKEHALKKAAKSAAHILEGDANILPTSTACKYCRFGEICRFDPKLGCRYRAVEKKTVEQLLKEGGDDE